MTFPLDITKTRLQIQGERASTVSSTTATNVPYRGMVRTAVGIGEYTEATARGRNNISKNYTRIKWYGYISVIYFKCKDNTVFKTRRYGASVHFGVVVVELNNCKCGGIVRNQIW